MEPNKIDQKVNASFEKRTIAPSAQSWEKLSARLHEKQQHKSRKYWVFGVAASFLAGILLTTLFFKGNETLNTVPVVIQKNAAPASLEEKVSSENNLNKKQPRKEEVLIVSNEINPSSKSKTEKTPTEHSVKLAEEKTKQVAQHKTEKIDFTEEVPAVAQSTEQLVNQTSARILKDLQNNDAGQEVTDAEIDRLIRRAQLEVRTDAILKGRKNQINAQALLNSVENDVDRSFRERVFTAVQDGLHEVKTALANRNF